MKSENAPEISIDFQNKFRFKKIQEIKDELSLLNKLTKSYEKEIQLSEINTLINKILEKNNNDIYKNNKEYSKSYKKEFPFTEQDLNESVKKVLSSNYYPNFIFNKRNLQDISRILYYAFKNMKNYGVNNEEKLKKKIESITIQEKDIINMYIDFDLIKREKSEINKNQLYLNKNPKSFRSTGNLATINELSQESEESNINGLTAKINKINLNSSGSECDSGNEGVKNIFKKIKNIFDSNSSKKDKKEKKELNMINSDINDIEEISKTKEGKLLILKEYLIYPEKNNINIKYELPIEFIILLKKFENVKSLTFQIKGMTKKMLKENIFILSNINLLFPNFSEITIDLNDDKLCAKINKIYQIRQEELLKQYKSSFRILKYKKYYQSRTTNCWIPEGDIIFSKNSEEDNNIETNINKEKKKYYFIENINENANIYGNKLNSINEKDYPNIKYITPLGNKSYPYSRNEFFSFDELDESEEISTGERTFSEFNKINESLNQLNNTKRKSTSNSTMNTLRLKEIPKMPKSYEATYIEINRKKTTPQLLHCLVKKKQEPFEMIFLYSFFFAKMHKIKKLSLYFNDSFSLETEFYLRNKDISFEGFHFLLLLNNLKELNEINISFNSIDKTSFKKILGLININKNISILRLNFFPPNINYEVTSLLKLGSLNKFSLHHLYKEQKHFLTKEKNMKDLEMDYFLLNHKFDNDFEKNISSLFNTIKSNINNYKEISFRFDLPLLIQSCEKYLILIIKFIINIIILISNTKNNINTIKIISPELILDGRKIPFLPYLFKHINKLNKFKSNTNMTQFILKCKIYKIPDLFNFLIFNNINNIKSIHIGDMDFESFSGFINIYKANINSMHNLTIIKIGLNNTLITYDDKISKLIYDYIEYNTTKLDQKILFSFLEFNNDLIKLKSLIDKVHKAKINNILIQIGKNNIGLLNKINEKQKKELELLFIIMTKEKYKILIKDDIIKNIKKFFLKHKSKIVLCKSFFPNNNAI